MNVEALVPKAVSSVLGCPAAPPFGVGAAPAPAVSSASFPACSESEPKSHGDTSLREPAQRELSPIHRPPPALLDEQGNLQFHVEKLLRKRRHHGQYQYLVKWRGYPESWNSWEYERYPFGKIVRTPLTFSNAAVRVNLRPRTLPTSNGRDRRVHVQVLVWTRGYRGSRST